MPIDEIDKMFRENKVKEFLKDYEALCKKHRLVLSPTIKPGFEIANLQE